MKKIYNFCRHVCRRLCLFFFRHFWKWIWTSILRNGFFCCGKKLKINSNCNEKRQHAPIIKNQKWPNMRADQSRNIVWMIQMSNSGNAKARCVYMCTFISFVLMCYLHLHSSPKYIQRIRTNKVVVQFYYFFWILVKCLFCVGFHQFIFILLFFRIFKQAERFSVSHS